jgi:thiamine biosynthesis lipoprotein
MRPRRLANAAHIPDMRRRGLRIAPALLIGLLTGGVRPADSGRPATPPRDAGSATAAARTRVERRTYLMGTRVTLATLAADRARGLRTLERMLRGLEAVEAELSTWREDSLLSAVNRQPVGVSRPAPDTLCDLLLELRGWQRVTGGTFDPAVGTLIAAWGLREGGRWPSPRELDEARRDAGLEQLLVRPRPCRVTRRRAVTLDAGAFGKGAAIDRVAETVLGDHAGAWMIDLGGQVAVGSRDGEPWSVSLAHPRRRHEAAFRLRLERGSLATSGGSVRDLEVGGRRVGHILDPRTGRPVSRNGSVTVWHRSALAADVLSTALYVMGIDEGLAWAERRGIAACYLVSDPEGPRLEVRATRAFRRRFVRVAYSRASTRPARVARRWRRSARADSASRNRSASARTKRE